MMKIYVSLRFAVMPKLIHAHNNEKLSKFSVAEEKTRHVYKSMAAILFTVTKDQVKRN